MNEIWKEETYGFLLPGIFFPFDGVARLGAHETRSLATGFSFRELR